ncbi:MAG: SH3 domain-containing protein [Anaerolineae bacterium]|nr:SH3 domain-containing protein [Anaerolineae bacterium]
MRPLMLGVLLLIGPMMTRPAAAQESACALPTRLSSGIRARVEPGPGTPNNLRASPGLDGVRIGQIQPGEAFDVHEGPTCVDGYVWWQVQMRDDTVGWTAEGDPAGRYWLEPLTLTVDPALDVLTLCSAPPDDYTVVDFGFARLNARTVAMLDQATRIYHTLGGLLEFDFREALVQGSYNPGGVAASFGTHDGGGAVDVSVREPVTRRVMQEEIAGMLRALRVAGFAAWLRDTDELYPGSPIHIHAIAIGDRDLSEAAREQIDGSFGYLRGYNGLPQDSGAPLPDTSGDLVLCPWLLDLGYHDLRGGSTE